MVRIAFILLCHRDPEGAAAQARLLSAAGDRVALHYDARAPRAEHARLRAAVAGAEGVRLVPRAVRCGWGEWSLVAATLRTLETARRAFPEATHFHLVSADCLPIKPADWVRARLAQDGADHIECADFFESDWIRTGLKEERLIYRHLVNERRRKWLFYRSLAVQRRLGLSRRIPADLTMRIGSQWWCLRRETVEKLLAFAARRRDVVRFFSTTWIPDETFFQTLVPHLVPREEIRARPPTFLMFTDYGMPVTFHDDHGDMLVGQDAFFARKVAAGAAGLRARLAALWTEAGREVRITGEGRRLYAYLAAQGREGRRFAPRVWEASARLARERELLVLVCKKWHVARRLAGHLRARGEIALDYVFDEGCAPLPDLGGIETSLEKRGRHRMAVIGLLFDHHGTDRLAICLDPARLDLLRTIADPGGAARILTIDCRLDDAYLAGHAMRQGLLPEAPDDSAVRRLLPTLRRDVAEEAGAIRDADLPRHFRIAEGRPPEENAVALAGFLSIPVAAAREIAQDPDLFAD
jgi:hypothetical protein